MKKNRVSSKIVHLLAITMLGTGAFAMAEGARQESYQREPDGAERSMSQATKDAWIQGKLEASFAYNQELSSFAIDTEVKNGVVHLEGNVESQTAKDLAEQLSLNIEGVSKVENDLRVVPGTNRQG